MIFFIIRSETIFLRLGVPHDRITLAERIPAGLAGNGGL